MRVIAGERQFTRVPAWRRASARCLWRWIVPILWLLASSGALKAAPGVTATLDRNTVSVGESVTLTVNFENLNPGGPPNLPAIQGITVAGVGQSTHMSIEPGGTVSLLSYNYVLVPSQPGDITIPAMSVAIQGQQFTTPVLKLKVLPASQAAPNPANETAFLRLVTPKNEIYLGEALPVDINLYFLELREARMPQLQAEGFTLGKMLQQRQTQSRVGGRVFMLVPFKSYVSGARVGNLTLGPASMQLAVPRANARRTIFGDIVDWQQVTLNSETQSIRVLSLPRTNVPPTFGGAVGTFNMSVTVGPTNVAVGDPITVKVTLTGQGLLEGINLPSQPAWSDFKVYTPNTKFDPADQFGLSGTKSFEQVVIPQSAEVKSLPAFQFSFFDPNLRTYRTLSGAPTPLLVRPVAAMANLPGTAPAPAQPAVTNDEIIHIKPFLSASPVSGAPLLTQPWFLGLQVVPLATWLSLFVVRRRREALANNPRLRRQLEVQRKIESGLTELRAHAAERQSEQFFALAFRLLQERLGERLDLPANAITEAVIDERLRPRNVPEPLLTELHELFQACNQARYARERSSQELASFIPRLEKALSESAAIKI